MSSDTPEGSGRAYISCTMRYASLVLVLVGCSGLAPTDDLIFVDGRAVAFAGDSLLAFTQQGSNEVFVRDRRSGQVSVHAGDHLTSPHHIQEFDGQWYVSDVIDGKAVIAVFSDRWEFTRRIGIDSVASVAHQFAILPNGAIVVESVDGRLLSIYSDSITTFALVESSTRNGMLVAAQGGIMHTVPGKTLTLYNEKGNVRWRQGWLWHDGAYVTDLSVDANGRVHLLAGEEGTNAFYAFTLSPITGEAVRWTAASRAATFVVARLGEIKPDSASRWLGGL